MSRIRPSRAKPRELVARTGYAPGHFMALARAHNWPPRFVAQLKSTRELEQSRISRENRERRQAAGDPGTIVGLSQRSDELIQQRLLARIRMQG